MSIVLQDLNITTTLNRQDIVDLVPDKDKKWVSEALQVNLSPYLIFNGKFKELVVVINDATLTIKSGIYNLEGNLNVAILTDGRYPVNNKPIWLPQVSLPFRGIVNIGMNSLTIIFRIPIINMDIPITMELPEVIRSNLPMIGGRIYTLY